jgi:hypothetical protein
MEGQDFGDKRAHGHGEADIFELLDTPTGLQSAPFIRLVSATALRLRAASRVLMTGKIPATFAVPSVSFPRSGAREKKTFTMPPGLQERFRIVPQLIESERNVLHIAAPLAFKAAHMRGKAIDVEALVSRERAIEELLLYLKERYEVKHVYAEGIPADTLHMLRRTRAAIEERRRDVSLTPPDVWNHIEHVARAAESEAFADEPTRAAILGLLSVEMRKELDMLLLAKAKAKRGENIPRRFALYFSILKESRSDFKTIIETMRDREGEIARSPLLKDDLLYLYGAAMKLFIEERIELYPAEIVATEKRSRTEPKTGVAKIREDTALSLVRNDLTKHTEPYIPLIFGDRHDFKNNIQTINQILSEPLGLVRLEYRE